METFQGLMLVKQPLHMYWKCLSVLQSVRCHLVTYNKNFNHIWLLYTKHKTRILLYFLWSIVTITGFSQYMGYLRRSFPCYSGTWNKKHDTFYFLTQKMQWKQIEQFNICCPFTTLHIWCLGLPAQQHLTPWDFTVNPEPRGWAFMMS